MVQAAEADADFRDSTISTGSLGAFDYTLDYRCRDLCTDFAHDASLTQFNGETAYLGFVAVITGLSDGTPFETTAHNNVLNGPFVLTLTAIDSTYNPAFGTGTATFRDTFTQVPFHHAVNSGSLYTSMEALSSWHTFAHVGTTGITGAIGAN